MGENWLTAYSEAFAAWPQAVLFGGPIYPKLEGTPPPWLSRAIQNELFAGVYAFRDLGVDPVQLEFVGHKIPYGPNFAVRAEEQRAFVFDSRLGLRKKSNLRGEEIDVVARILNSGAEGRWVPQAPVQHVIPESFQTFSSLHRYFVGIGKLRVHNNPHFDGSALMGAPRWLWLAVPKAYMRFLAKRVIAPPETWCLDFRQAAILTGLLIGYRTATR